MLQRIGNEFIDGQCNRSDRVRAKNRIIAIHPEGNENGPRLSLYHQVYDSNRAEPAERDWPSSAQVRSISREQRNPVADILKASFTSWLAARRLSMAIRPTMTFCRSLPNRSAPLAAGADRKFAAALRWPCSDLWSVFSCLPLIVPDLSIGLGGSGPGNRLDRNRQDAATGHSF